MPWKPSEPGEVPTLGYEVIAWITANLAAPDRAEYEPFLLYPEQEDFVLRFYELHPITGKRRRRRGVVSRGRGWGKSPFLASLALAEAMAAVVPDGWDADGQPVGKPWATVRTPVVQILAVSEKQTGNTWAPLLEMCQGPVIDNYPGLEPLDTFVNLPRGKIEPITSSARTVKGNRPVFAVLDQTEEWVKSNGGINLFEKVKNNTAKVGGSFVESPNAFTPGEDSVAERSAGFWSAIREGRAKDDGLYYDHREAPGDTDMSERESLTLGLRVAYGDSSGHPDGCLLHEPACPPGHVDLDVLVATIWDPTSDVQVSRADFLNQITHASDSWVTAPEWAADYDPDAVLADGDKITLGFDGSRGRAAGVADATALVAVRVSDCHAFDIGVWEQPDGPEGKGWTPPEHEVDAAVTMAFDKYRPVGFYADPTMWDEHVARWQAKYGRRLKVKAGQNGQIRWPKQQMTKVVRTLAALHSAITAGELSHNGSSVLSRHVLNSRRRFGTSGMYIAKSSPGSPKKIDAAYALMLAYAAYLDYIAKGGTSSSGRGRVLVMD